MAWSALREGDTNERSCSRARQGPLVCGVIGAGTNRQAQSSLHPPRERHRQTGGAAGALARIIADLGSGAFVEPNKTTVAVFLQRWLAHIKTQVGAATFRRYWQHAGNTIIPELGTVRLCKLRPEQISEFYSRALEGGRHDDRDGGLSPRTVAQVHTMLKQALGQACVWRAIPYNPADLVKPPKVQRKEMKTIDTDATARMLDAARGTTIFIPVLLGVLCGLRRGEICALRWRSVDLENGQLAVVASRPQGGIEKETKGGRGRLIALPIMVVTELRRCRTQQAEQLLRLGVRLTDDHHVYSRVDGTPYWPGRLTRSFKSFMREHQLPQIRLHDLRHSHATHLLAAGVHPKIAQERLGHASISVTMDVYSHAMPGMQADAVARIDAAMQAALNKPKTK
jgi:integrase